MYKVTLRLAIAGLVMTVMLAACRFAPEGAQAIRGSGNIVTESRDVSGFDAVTLQGIGNVTIDQSGTESMTITTHDNYLPYIETVVQGGTLYIRTKDIVVFTDAAQLDFDISAVTLDAITMEGAGSITVNDLSTDKWQVKVPGAGQIRVSGTTVDQSVELKGAGNYQAENLESQTADIKSSGAGHAVVRVSDKLDVTIDGLGSVEYIGNPAVTQEINGVGTVTQRP